MSARTTTVEIMLTQVRRGRASDCLELAKPRVTLDGTGDDDSSRRLVRLPTILVKH